MTSVVQLSFYDAIRILFVHKENKNNDIIQRFQQLMNLLINFFSSVSKFDIHKMNEGLTGLERREGE